MKSILQKTLFFLLFLVPTIVLVVPESMFFPFITGRGFLFRVIVEMALGLYLALCLIDKSYLPKKNLLNISVGIFVAIIFIADLLAPYSPKALWSNFERMEGFVVIAHLGIFFLITSTIFSLKEWKKFFLTSLGVAIFLSYYGILQLRGVLDINQGGARLDTTMGNSAYFATYLLFHIFFASFLFFSEDKNKIRGISASVFGGSLWFILFYIWEIFNSHKLGNTGFLLFAVSLVLSIFCATNLFNENVKKKIDQSKISGFLYILVLINFVVLLYYTATRGAILGLIGGLIIGAIFIVFREKSDKFAKNISLAILGSVFIIISAFFIFKNTDFVKESPVLGRFASISWNETKTQARSYVWPMALEGIKERPLLGWGQEGFIYVFAKYYNPKLWSHEPWFDRAHNSFLDWLIAGGALGFLAYISLYINSLWMLIRSKISEKEKGILLALLVAYSFQALFVFDNLVSYIFFFALLALISTIFEQKQTNETKNNVLVKNEGQIVVAGIIFSLVLIYLVNASGYFQNRTLINALNIGGMKDGELVSCINVIEQKDKGGKKINVCKDWAPTLVLFEKALAYDSFGTAEVREHMTSLSYSVNSNPDIPVQIKSKLADMIITEYQKQIEKNPLDIRAYAFLGSYLSSIGFDDEAVSYFKEAIKLSSTRQSFYMKLGEIVLQKGEKEVGLEYLKKAYELDTNYPDALYQYVTAPIYTGNISQAETLFPKVVESESSLSPIMIDVMVKAGLGSKAEGLLYDRIKKYPDREDNYALLYSYYVNLKNNKKAIEVINLMTSNNPNLSEKAKDYMKKIGY